MYKSIILLISLIVIIKGSSVPTKVVTFQNGAFVSQFQFYSLTNGSLIDSISAPLDTVIAITSIDTESVTYISNQVGTFNFNSFDFKTQTNKVISSINFPNTNDVTFSFQQILTNAPSLNNVFTIYGKNSTNYFYYLKLDFKNTIYTLVNIGENQILDGSYFSGGYDYFNSSFYYSYVSNYHCITFGSVDVNSLVPTVPERCIMTTTYNPFDINIPVVFNSTKYLISTMSTANSVQFELFAIIEGVIDSLPLFEFFNIANDPKNIIQPINYVTLNNEYLTLALYSSLDKYQYFTISLIDYSMSSVMGSPLSGVDAILTF
ncbi:hypothetical protein DICPUDRAFT_156990 [Dictyostelium purpureum]|uniref:Uncharacterized protein n=1 Tax=Dictyostelium purpureum TaxID=5786 RepID=F0ZXZ3_DICPU|nr:uncharacterized protein DICPUDRAFT_156990 [Dictyostelium purpureum]EGC31198.1 hypothetical protein DICPUDRAFT_156990 [Dictyostelium purpureum]|eukprot:XP_003292287.1 hypothetical protein DICPUDRAFT_156990 [Dictyostelium purpureum]